MAQPRTQARRDVVGSALGLVSTRSFPAIVGVADMMLKTSGVTLVGYEKIGDGYCCAIVRGGITDVRLAVAEGASMAAEFDQLVTKAVIPRPLPNLEVVLPISDRFHNFLQQEGHSRLSKLAVGLVETRGFPAMVAAADMMLKTADVQLAAYEKTGAGLCTAIVRGRVADVSMAVEAGMYEAERVGELHAVMVIPRVLDELEHTLPTASCWLDQPLEMPVAFEQRVAEPELMEMPNFQEMKRERKDPLPVEPLPVEPRNTRTVSPFPEAWNTSEIEVESETIEDEES